VDCQQLDPQVRIAHGWLTMRFTPVAAYARAFALPAASGAVYWHGQAACGSFRPTAAGAETPCRDSETAMFLHILRRCSCLPSSR